MIEITDGSYSMMRPRDIPKEAQSCPVDGLEPVTMVRNVPADRVRISIVPAARVSDEVTGRVAFDSEYLLELRPWQGPGLLRSTETMSWEVVVERGSVVQGTAMEGRAATVGKDTAWRGCRALVPNSVRGCGSQVARRRRPVVPRLRPRSAAEGFQGWRRPPIACIGRSTRETCPAG